MGKPASQPTDNKPINQPACYSLSQPTKFANKPHKLPNSQTTGWFMLTYDIFTLRDIFLTSTYGHFVPAVCFWVRLHMLSLILCTIQKPRSSHSPVCECTCKHWTVGWENSAWADSSYDQSILMLPQSLCYSGTEPEALKYKDWSFCYLIGKVVWGCYIHFSGMISTQSWCFSFL